MINKFVICFGLIIILSGLLRLCKLSDFPVSLSMDEASVSYDAYSILKTGRDMYGNFLPLAFRSTGDYKSPVLTYLMVPAIAVFGLNEFATRITIVIISVLSVVATYYLTKELTHNRSISLLTSFFIGISPWHIQYSRATFDYVLADFFLISAVWIFIRSVKNKCKNLWLSVSLFALSAYSYHAERLMVPLFSIGLAWLWRKKLFENKRNLLFALIFGITISLPLINILLHNEGQARATSVFIGQDSLINSDIKESESEIFLEKLFGNKLILIFNFWVKRYLNYWDINYLFFDGSRLTQPNFPDVGLFNVFEIFPFFLGLWLVLKPNSSYLQSKEKTLLFIWLLLGPLAASLTNNDQHAGRAFSLIPAPHILIGIGAFLLVQKIKQLNYLCRFVASVSIFFVVFLSLIYFMDIYFVHFPIQFSEFWGYGRKQAIEYALTRKSEYKEIIIDPSYGTMGQTTIDAPYLYALYYTKFDPLSFQSEKRRFDWKDSMNFSNFTFRSIYWPKDCQLTNRLFIGSPWSLPPKDIPQNHILKTIFFKNGNVAFYILENLEAPSNCQII